MLLVETWSPDCLQLLVTITLNRCTYFQRYIIKISNLKAECLRINQTQLTKMSMKWKSQSTGIIWPDASYGGGGEEGEGRGETVPIKLFLTRTRQTCYLLILCGFPPTAWPKLDSDPHLRNIHNFWPPWIYYSSYVPDYGAAQVSPTYLK